MTTVRLATPADSAALVRLRAEMFAAIGQDVGAEDAPWRAAARAWFEGAVDGAALVAVAEEPGAGVVASAMAVLLPRAPSPEDPSASSAHVSQVSTLPGHRRRGHARACLRLLLDELERRGVVRADLHATAEGDALYRGLGFTEPAHPALRRRV
ncbi:GNAT family N-acetyltransferase [Amnibacterium endophyticum]|uniref:GNAT family N-acetyltransferase n=1 Tax=Amnibacterium endophyticum TaxID=2109337 RepID=A0ABW4LDX1_9MICO